MKPGYKSLVSFPVPGTGTIRVQPGFVPRTNPTGRVRGLYLGTAKLKSGTGTNTTNILMVSPVYYRPDPIRLDLT